MLLFFTKEAQKHYQRLDPPNRKKITKKLSLLEEEPLSGKRLSGQLAGQYSLKTWPYRIIYYIDPVRHEIWITGILHRQGAYQ